MKDILCKAPKRLMEKLSKKYKFLLIWELIGEKWDVQFRKRNVDNIFIKQG